MNAYRIRLLLVTAFACVTPPTAILGQAAQTHANRATIGRTPVLVALVDQVPHGRSYEIIRRPTGPAREVILLRAGSTEAELSEAVRALVATRLHATKHQALGTFRMRGGVSASARALPWSGRVIADLRAAPRQKIDGVGTVRAVQIWLPGRMGSPTR